MIQNSVLTQKLEPIGESQSERRIMTVIGDEFSPLQFDGAGQSSWLPNLPRQIWGKHFSRDAVWASME